MSIAELVLHYIVCRHTVDIQINLTIIRDCLLSADQYMVIVAS